MYCNNCHGELPASSHICQSCGKPFDVDDPSTFEPQPRRPFWPVAGKGFGVCFVIWAFLAVALFYSVLKAPDSSEDFALLLTGMVTLIVYSAIAYCSMSWPFAFGSAIGAIWGFVICMAIIFNIQSDPVHTDWPMFLISLILFPLILFCIGSPFVLWSIYNGKAV